MLAADRVKLLVDSSDVADPIGGSREEYQACANTIEQGLRSRLQEVSL